MGHGDHFTHSMWLEVGQSVLVDALATVACLQMNPMDRFRIPVEVVRSNPRAKVRVRWIPTRSHHSFTNFTRTICKDPNHCRKPGRTKIDSVPTLPA